MRHCGCHELRVVRGEPLHRRCVEQVGVVLQCAAVPRVGRTENELDVELCRVSRTGELCGRHARQGEVAAGPRILK